MCRHPRDTQGTRLWILFNIQDQNLQVLNSIFNLQYLELPINLGESEWPGEWQTTTIPWGILVSLSTLEPQENGGSPASLCSQEKDSQCKVKANTLAPIKILPLTMMANFSTVPLHIERNPTIHDFLVPEYPYPKVSCFMNVPLCVI